MVRETNPSRTSSGHDLSPQKRDVQERIPLANISAKMQSPSPKAPAVDGDGKAANISLSDITFGEASPLRNPLRGPTQPRKQTSSIFMPKQRPQQSIRPTTTSRVTSDEYPADQRDFYFPGQRQASSSWQAAHDANAQRNHGPSATNIYRPTNAPLQTFHPPKPTFSSTAQADFYKSALNPPKSVVDLTAQDDDSDGERFDPDAAIRAESRNFGSEDPYMYVDANKASENIKNLLEGAFDDEESKGKTRLRRRAKTRDAEEAESKGLASKLAALNVKDDTPTKDDDEDAEEEEDGTVDGLAVKLLPHQVEGVSWMIDKEIGQKKVKGVLPYGGILADDMGLGKTVQSVALLLTNPRPALDAKPERKNQKMPGREVGKGTLVVAPLALIKQWESEIKTKVSKSHALKVLVHHGASRTKSGDQLRKYDVVITTFQTLTSEHAGSNMLVSGGTRIGCFGVHWYRVMLDEAHSIKNRNAKATQACYALNSWYRWCLTGTPMQNNLDELQSLIKFLCIKPYCEQPSWKQDIIQPMKNGRGGLAMRRLQYFLRAFMKRRTKDILKQEGALNFGGKTGKDGENKGGMQIVKREVLTVECELDEEEQDFYSRLQARADKRLDEMAHAAKADYIGALVLLLRLRQACNHPRLVEMSMSKDKDAMTTGMAGAQTPRKPSGNDMDDLAALMGGISVQTKHCDVCQVKLSPVEARDGAVRCSECEDDLAAVKKKQKEKKHKTKATKSKAQAVKAEVKLEQRRARNRRIIDDSDDDEDESHAEQGKAGTTDDEDEEGGGETLDTIDSDRSDEDDSDVVDSPSRAKRISGRGGKEGDEVSDVDDQSEEDDEDGESDDSDSEANILDGVGTSGKSSHTPSTKIRHLLRILHKESPKHKTIVFSQFTTMLDLIEPPLKTSGLRFVRYDGSMRPDAREQSLNSLRTDPKTRVLLCSLKCGSLGLNLTAASRVVIVEPFWNPFVEEQAIDRVHRLNQTVDVKVFRLTVRNSVEERIIELQEKKRELAKAAIEGGKGVGKLSMKDILGLFKRDAEHGGHDEEDRELWQKFGGDNRLLDHRNEISTDDRGTTMGTGSRPVSNRPQAKARPHQEHDVYGRRW
ncbi:hypothetical protein CLAFUW4_00395 [Fulvia fulva]|nr:hypothetical protein CLAFUR4_00395 [Fulvia fulva]KAK4636604.1 hypothetical protein CLAFUR0_00396 [Fulvia fulva]WPV09684.1 hypothetical protein CLAFUW4_00395 [Fulvia fulva]WPV23838.1 hypothetical protein CLAFUW7_00399 [Fulvia fulva]